MIKPVCHEPEVLQTPLSVFLVAETASSPLWYMDGPLHDTPNRRGGIDILMATFYSGGNEWSPVTSKGGSP